MAVYTITRLFDVRAWRKAEMEFASDEEAAAHVEKLAQDEREGFGPPPDHPLEDASNATDFDEGGRVSYFLDKDRDSGGYADEVCSRDAYTLQELAQEYGPQMLAALRLAKPVCADAYYDALAVQENPTGDAVDYPAENAQATAAARAAWEAVNAAIALAEGREPQPLGAPEADTPDATDALETEPAPVDFEQRRDGWLIAFIPISSAARQWSIETEPKGARWEHARWYADRGEPARAVRQQLEAEGFTVRES